jgi:D-glycero-beta-D-manno-heptose-7-phosphate kinase
LNQSEITRVFKSFESKNVLIVGDVMIDAYLIGKVNRISPEAPVPIVSVTEREKRLGGASNVALNIKALGANPIMASVISDDDVAIEFIKLLTDQNLTTEGIVQSKSRVTSTKTRIISNYQQLIRVDEEIEDDLSNADEQTFINHLNAVFKNNSIDVVILQDYNKGVLTKRIIEHIIELAAQKNIPISADPKKRNFLSFKNVTLFKPNLKELSEGLNIDAEPTLNSLTNSITELQELMPCKNCLITLSEKGVFISSPNQAFIYPAHLRNIADVSGAGDTVIAVASLCLTANLSIEDTAKLANLSGGLVCEKIGVVPIDKERLMEEAITVS